MDVGCRSFLESVTQKTLHAHNFNRSSSEASHVLTDLLSRYLALLSATCAQYAQHSGRTGVTMVDAAMALEEIGVSVDELSEYCETEGREMARYGQSTSRRAEELSMLKESLMDGLKQDHDDAFWLVYKQVPSPSSSIKDEDEAEEDLSEGNDAKAELVFPRREPDKSALRASPPLPPSPISRSPTPARKRQRNANWNPPDYIPDFLPPYPRATPPPSPTIKQEAEFAAPRIESHERLPTPPPQLATSTSGSDYLTPVPYTMSSLHSLHESHLPERPDPRTLQQVVEAQHPTPQPQKSLITAYHYVLTNPPPPQPSSNPLRHKVAMSLLAQMYANPRWTAPDTLFSNIAPPRPRVVAPAPSCPVPLKEASTSQDADKAKRQPVMPPASTRTIVINESLTPISSQPSSRIPEIANQILPISCIKRTTRLVPPPPLISASGEKFLYGHGVPAPWNLSSSNAPVAQGKDAKGGKARDRGNSNATVNGAGAVNGVGGAGDGYDEHPNKLVDARLFSTWDWDVHDFRLPPPSNMQKRWRTGSTSLPHRPSISINVGGSSSSNVGAGGGGPVRKKTKDVKADKVK